MCVCFPTGVVLQVQWSQKNGKKRPFLLRLSFTDVLQDQFLSLRSKGFHVSRKSCARAET